MNKIIYLVGHTLQETRPIELFLKMGQRALKEGEFDRAVEYFEEALSLAHNLGAPLLIAKCESYISDIRAKADLKEKLISEVPEEPPPELDPPPKTPSPIIKSSLTIVEVQTSDGEKWPKQEENKEEKEQK